MTETQTIAPLNILLADDDTDDRYFFEKALEELSIATKLKTVPDGEKLMDYLYKNPDNLPDVLFLDINMPRKNGSECLTEIKGSETLKRIPVVLCSTSLGDDFANALYENGAHYYLHKCDFADLKKCLYKTLVMLAKNPTRPPRHKFMLSLQEA
jgi:CheY-like chemotaxis protein